MRVSFNVIQCFIITYIKNDSQHFWLKCFVYVQRPKLHKTDSVYKLIIIYILIKY